MQEKAVGIKILKEVEELAVSKLDKSKQSASDAPCQAAKQFLHEAPYEQVRTSLSCLQIAPLLCVHCLMHYAAVDATSRNIPE